ncbi:hypothetical protein D3093_32720 (plasmid) [Azospirillum argentinense]|uniref:Uncharacterized protein n=1 Tax=Azospirillum argentinense TaxID=2970906 RepID=A0A4D8PPS5_9PROT|nr:hypothetical protein [Azospirillum argentinense]QCO00033.1 hypothetical protein D3093_32720 [Azospirillum argentinense]
MSVISFPNQDRGAQRPASPEFDVQRLTFADAADWQRAIIGECRRQRTLTPAVFSFLKAEGLIDRCTFLASEAPGDAIRFRYIGMPTLRVLGRAWGRSVIGQPEEVDPHSEFAHRVGLEYAEAIGAGEALFNRFSVTELGRPFVYTQALYGWEDRGWRAVLSCIDVQTLH